MKEAPLNILYGHPRVGRAIKFDPPKEGDTFWQLTPDMTLFGGPMATYIKHQFINGTWTEVERGTRNGKDHIPDAE